MPWPYQFLALTEAQIEERRVLLDRYGVYSQLSGLVPVACYQLYRLARWVHRERQRSKVTYTAVPSSPDRKRVTTSSLGRLRTQWRRFVWWLGGEFFDGWGLRGQWIAMAGWFSWLLFLCLHRTGNDYFHVTKRFAEIAVAQFPLHYMLIMKSRYAPLAVALNASHEDLNSWHQLNGRVIYTFIVCHVTLYINGFIQNGTFEEKMQQLNVIFGTNSMIYLTILMTTSLQLIRRWSYRVFFVLHLVIGVGLLIMLFFHATHLRIYVTEAMALFVFDVILRKLDTTTGYAVVTAVPNTKLVKATISIPQEKHHRFSAAPGQHVYLNIPPRSRPAGASFLSIHEILYNPFTIASVTEKDITLVLRSLRGPTSKALTALTKLPKAKPPIHIEGPLGCTQHFPNLVADYDRILLVAGGVGATFALPIYQSLKSQLEAESAPASRLTLIWTMRSAAEANWSISTPSSRKKMEEDENIKIFVSRSVGDNKDHTQEDIPADGSVEMDELLPQEEPIAVTGRERPDLRAVVDEVFKKGKGEKVAVLVCGPDGMGRELRRHLGKWVSEGREVWFHDEAFGF